MMFKRKNQLVGLDIGSSFIKVAELDSIKNEYVLKKFGISPIRPGTIIDGRIEDKRELAKQITALFDSQEIKTKNVAISTGGQAIVVKNITVDKVDDEEMQKNITAEAAQYIPYDINDVNIDFQVLGESEFYSEHLNVLLVAAKKELVAEYVDLISMAGLTPKVIDIDTFALQNIFETLPVAERNNVFLLADIGASKISLNILKNGNSMLMRDNAAGVGHIYEEIAIKLNVDIQEAEYLFRNKFDRRDYDDQIEQICLDAITLWCGEIQEVVNTFRSGASDDALQKVFLTGGGVFVEGFSEKLSSELDIPVAILSPFEGFDLDQNVFSSKFLEEVGPQASVALGLALRQVDDK